MIHRDSLSVDWIQSVAGTLGRIDKALLEKAIRALFLAEQLKIQGVHFQFKEGTSLLLKLPEPRRFSIDVDIVTTDSRAALEKAMDAIVFGGFFTRWEEDVRRRTGANIPVEHFKLFYISHFPGFTPESYVLLDVIYQQELPFWVEDQPCAHQWLMTTEEPHILTVSTREGLLGDKLTAFAPKTTGILYSKGRPLEIIKQLYDIAALFDHTHRLDAVREVFTQVADWEIAARGLKITREDVLEDIFQAAFTLCQRDEKDPAFQMLKAGIINIKPHIFHRFILEDAIVAASKVMYLTRLLKKDETLVLRFGYETDLSQWMLDGEEYKRFNRYKKTLPEAFFYIFQACSLI